MSRQGGIGADFFRARLEQMVDPRHALVVLGSRLPWSQLEVALKPYFAKKEREPRVIPGAASAGILLFDEERSRAGGKLLAAGVSAAGRPRIDMRLMISLLYLKHAYNLSDEALCERWSENVVWQYFSGREYYDPRPPCDPTQIGRFRTRVGEAGMSAILKATIDTAIVAKAVQAQEFERIIVDTTVQEKAIAYPVDSRLLEVARHHLVKAAKASGVSLKQTFAREGKQLKRQAGGYAHARQMKRLQKTVKRQRTIVQKLIREIARKREAATDRSATTATATATTSAVTTATTTAATTATTTTPATGKAQASAQIKSPATVGDATRPPSSGIAATVLQSAKTKASAWLDTVIERAGRISTQQTHDKDKLYAMHAPEVECISKGKARQRYEFGVKVSLVQTYQKGLIIGAKRFAGNPYDGHTLKAQIAQCHELISNSGQTIKQAYVDLGYRGVDKENLGIDIQHRGRIKSMTKTQRKALKRRQAIEPSIGHMKDDNGLRRCYLKGAIGDALHVIACAAGYNIRWLLRAIKRLGLRALFALLSAYQRPSLLALWVQICQQISSFANRHVAKWPSRAWV